MRKRILIKWQHKINSTKATMKSIVNAQEVANKMDNSKEWWRLEAEYQKQKAILSTMKEFLEDLLE